MTKFLSLIVLLLLINNFLVYSADNERQTSKLNFGKQYRTVAVFGMGYPFPSKSYKFFDIFSKHFGTERNVVKAYPLMMFKFKGEFIQNYRLGVSLEYFKLLFDESYIQYYEDSFQSGNRSLTQSITMDNIPLLFTAEYLPYSLPYKSYFGLGLGLNISNVKWEETLSSGLIVETRKGGEHYNKSFFAPSFKIYSGLELKFDRESVNKIINSLVLEISFNYSIMHKEIFDDVKTQFTPIPKEFNERYSIVPLQIMFNLGITVDFDPITKN